MIKFILFVAIFYLLFRLLTRVVLPWFVVSKFNKMQKDQQKATQDLINKKRKEEGKVFVDYIPNKGESSKEKDGEYVDYEEVKE